MRRRLTTAWVLGAVFALIVGVIPAFGAVSGVAPVTNDPGLDPGYPSRSPSHLTFADAALPIIIGAPDSVELEAWVSDTEFFVFDEQQGWTLEGDLVTDTATIDTGTVVDSHFVHFDNDNRDGGIEWNRAVGEITFECPIIGLITTDARLDATDVALGADMTIYPNGLINRGLEFRSNQDMIEVSSDMLTLFVDLQAREVMDQIRVVTYSCDGFVTGGGWIDSPAGAYVDYPEMVGKATFGFVSKYKKGASVPTGNTEFQFQTGDLNFHSSSYDWLVVTGSNYAMFKGVGTINGEGDFKFRIWAGDDEPDTFRIKIWTEDEFDVETIVYDNGVDQAIGGGSIVIHTKK